MFKSVNKNDLTTYYKKILDPRNLIEMRAELMLLRKIFFSDLEDDVFCRTAESSKFLTEIVMMDANKNNTNKTIYVDPLYESKKEYVQKMVHFIPNYV